MIKEAFYPQTEAAHSAGELTTPDVSCLPSITDLARMAPPLFLDPQTTTQKLYNYFWETMQTQPENKWLSMNKVAEDNGCSKRHARRVFATIPNINLIRQKFSAKSQKELTKPRQITRDQFQEMVTNAKNRTTAMGLARAAIIESRRSENLAKRAEIIFSEVPTPQQIHQDIFAESQDLPTAADRSFPTQGLPDCLFYA